MSDHYYSKHQGRAYADSAMDPSSYSKTTGGSGRSATNKSSHGMMDPDDIYTEIKPKKRFTDSPYVDNGTSTPPTTTANTTTTPHHSRGRNERREEYSSPMKERKDYTIKSSDNDIFLLQQRQQQQQPQVMNKKKVHNNHHNNKLAEERESYYSDTTESLRKGYNSIERLYGIDGVDNERERERGEYDRAYTRHEGRGEGGRGGQKVYHNRGRSGRSTYDEYNDRRDTHRYDEYNDDDEEEEYSREEKPNDVDHITRRMMEVGVSHEKIKNVLEASGHQMTSRHPHGTTRYGVASGGSYAHGHGHTHGHRTHHRTNIFKESQLRVKSNIPEIKMIIGEMKPPKDLLDPLFHELMNDPVVLSSGRIVDRTSVMNDEGEFRFTTCPFTREELKTEVFPVAEKKNQIEEFKGRRDRAINDFVRKLLSEGDFKSFHDVMETIEFYLRDVGEIDYLPLLRQLADIWAGIDVKKERSPTGAPPVFLITDNVHEEAYDTKWHCAVQSDRLEYDVDRIMVSTSYYEKKRAGGHRSYLALALYNERGALVERSNLFGNQPPSRNSKYFRAIGSNDEIVSKARAGYIYQLEYMASREGCPIDVKGWVCKIFPEGPFSTFRMKDQEGEEGFYTGPTDAEDKAHGGGSLDYLDGTRFVGKFSHGVLDTGVLYHGSIPKFTMERGRWVEREYEAKFVSHFPQDAIVLGEDKPGDDKDEDDDKPEDNENYSTYSYGPAESVKEVSVKHVKPSEHWRHDDISTLNNDSQTMATMASRYSTAHSSSNYDKMRGAQAPRVPTVPTRRHVDDRSEPYQSHRSHHTQRATVRGVTIEQQEERPMTSPSKKKTGVIREDELYDSTEMSNYSDKIKEEEKKKKLDEVQKETDRLEKKTASVIDQAFEEEVQDEEVDLRDDGDKSQDAVKLPLPVFVAVKLISGLVRETGKWHCAKQSPALEYSAGKVLVSCENPIENSSHIALALYDPSGELVERCVLFEKRTKSHCHRVLDTDDDIVSKSKSSYIYQLEYLVEGDTSTKIHVEGLVCKIFPSSVETPSYRISDQEGDRGLYLGPVDSEGKAHGLGSLEYDHGARFVGGFHHGAIMTGALYFGKEPRFTMKEGQWCQTLDKEIIRTFRQKDVDIV